METGTDKRKLIITGSSKAETYMNGLCLLTFHLFKTGSSMTDIHIRILTATVAMARVDRVWHNYNIRFTSHASPL